MKLIAAIAFVALLIAAVVALADENEGSCMEEMQRHSMERCRSFMRYGGSEGRMIETEVEENEGAPEECCNQLRRVSRECRCPIIRSMVQDMKAEEGFRGQECSGRCGEMMMRGRLLPAMCSMEPHTCRMRQGAGY